MRLVYIPGCWDLLHTGHLNILERAKALGHTLVVGVASDEVISLDKGTYPIVDLVERVRLLNALKCVDIAAPYYQLEFLTHLNCFKPDILAVGETWGTDVRHQEAEAWCEMHYVRFIKLPYTRGISTTFIKEQIYERSIRHADEAAT